MTARTISARAGAQALRTLEWLLAHGALLVTLCAVAGVQAQGASPREAKQYFEAGATAYAMGDYRAAIQAFDAAYTLTPLPAIAFSLAQAERREYFASQRTINRVRSASAAGGSGPGSALVCCRARASGSS